MRIVAPLLEALGAVRAGLGKVNNLLLDGSATTAPLTVTAAGTDANVSINLVPKGTGLALINGVAIPRYIKTAGTLPTGTRVDGDIWEDTDSLIVSRWVITTSGGQWVGIGGAGLNWIPFTPTDIEVTTSGKGIVFRADDGSRWRQTVTAAGASVLTKLV